MKITACSIVKNEAHNIARSIESYNTAVDEIIIVDTGSTDNTVDICKLYGAKTLFYEWNNDFSAAKNYALENANGDWIIFLDADEWFVPKLSRKVITDVLKQIDTVADGLMTTMCEYNDKTDKVFSREITTRIFRNSKQIRFIGSIHERLKNNDAEITQAHCPDLEIFHSGYANGLVEMKSKRNIDILYSLYNKGNKTTALYYYLFRENYILGKTEEAIKFYELFFKQENADYIVKNDAGIICIYEFMYRIMEQNPKDFTQNNIYILLETAYKKYPKLPMHSYLLGCEQLKANKFGESCEWFNNAIKLNNQYLEPFTNSFVAFLSDTYYKMGYISQVQGNPEQALSYYMQAVKGSSNIELEVILQKLVNIIGGEPEEDIILFLNGLIDMKKKESVEAVLAALKMTRLHKAFVYYALKYNQEFDGQDETTYIAMILTGQVEQAIKTAIAASKNAREKLVDNKLVDETNVAICDNWHMDYAVISVLYSKSKVLYEKYRVNFSLVQRGIIEAYLEGKMIEKSSIQFREECEKIYDKAFYIFTEQDILNLRCF